MTGFYVLAGDCRAQGFSGKAIVAIQRGLWYCTVFQVQQVQGKEVIPQETGKK